MNIDNIHKIMKSSLWKKIEKNPHYLDYKILRAGQPHDKQMRALLVFFHRNISNRTLKAYWKEGAGISERESLESGYENIPFYGIVKMLVYC